MELSHGLETRAKAVTPSVARRARAILLPLPSKTCCMASSTRSPAKCIDMAKAGEPVALKLCMERLMPPVKGRHLSLDLPVITDAASALQAMCEVARAVGHGEITTDDATAVAGIVEINRRTIETASLERRIKALEQTSGTGGHDGS
jgi:hypothetical protein